MSVSTDSLRSMSVDALQSLISASHSLIQQKNAEEEQAKRNALLTNDKTKKLAEKLKGVKERLATFSGKTEITINIPIKFTLDTTLASLRSRYYSGELEVGEVFERNVTGKLLRDNEDINRKQRLVLQEGVDQIIKNACDVVYDLFPTTKEQEKIVKELDKIKNDADAIDLNLLELERISLNKSDSDDE